MRLPPERVAHIQVLIPRDRFVATVHQVNPSFASRTESILWLLIVCAFWGLIAYAAIGLN